MIEVKQLTERIDGLFAAAKEKAKQREQTALEDLLARQARVREYEKIQAQIVQLTRPRLEALVKRAGDRVKVMPSVSETRRAVSFEFRSTKAYIVLSFSIAPDQNVENVVIDYDLKIVPVLWKFDSHAEFTTPIANPNEAGLINWLDDRIVGFVDLFIQIHEGEIYTSAEQVEDPVAHIKFPKFAAGAILEQSDKTYYFINNQTKDEFEKLSSK